MSAASASIGHLNYCAHPGCQCQVNPGERYCGEYCRKTAEDTAASGFTAGGVRGACSCGHAACRQ